MVFQHAAAQKKRNGGPGITYRVCGIGEYEYPADAWDCVVSNLALHYIEDLEEVFRKVFQTLKQDGVFLFNIEHPVFTSGVGQDWVYGDDGQPRHWPVDGYFTPGKRETHFLGCSVLKYHHTLIFRPAAWNAFGMDKEGQDYRACAAYGPLYKNIRG